MLLYREGYRRARFGDTWLEKFSLSAPSAIPAGTKLSPKGGRDVLESYYLRSRLHLNAMGLNRHVGHPGPDDRPRWQARGSDRPDAQWSRRAFRLGPDDRP